MKQTAVEWLIEIHFGSIENCTPLFRKHIEQAKEIEKQQIAHSWAASLWAKEIDQTFEEYYNETYKSEQ